MESVLYLRLRNSREGPDQLEYRENSVSKLTRGMVCEVKHKNSNNIEQDSKSSEETSTNDIPSSTMTRIWVIDM